MKAWPLWLAALAASSAPAAAQALYDTKLERAVMEIVARRIGDIRTTPAPDHLAESLAVAAREVDRTPPPKTGPSAGRGWKIVGGLEIADSTTTGSFQAFTDRQHEIVGPAHPATLPPKTVSRIIAY